MVAARNELGIAQDATVLAILPGSRMSEIKHNTEAFIGAAKLLTQRDPKLLIVVPMVGAKQRARYIELIIAARLDDVPVLLVEGKSHLVMAAANSVLVASGTATLEVALFKKPMVIAYKMMEATWQIQNIWDISPGSVCQIFWPESLWSLNFCNGAQLLKLWLRHAGSNSITMRCSKA